MIDFDAIAQAKRRICQAPGFLHRHDLCFKCWKWGEELTVWEFGFPEKAVTFFPVDMAFTIRETGETKSGALELLKHFKGEEYVKRIRSRKK